MPVLDQLPKNQKAHRKSSYLMVNYEVSDGQKRHNRLWNGGTGIGRLQLFERHSDKFDLVDGILAASIGCEYGEEDAWGSALWARVAGHFIH